MAQERRTTKELATAQKVSQRRIQQLLKACRETGRIILKRLGRKRKPIPLEQIKLILKKHPSNSCALYMKDVIHAKHKIHIPRNTIHIAKL